MNLDLDNTLVVAPALLGWLLIHDSPEGRTAGYIVETEAYKANDASSHSYHGKTLRNEVMFGPPGHLYVYFIYGMHYCVNIVTGPAGSGEAVLIRALQPLDGINLMRIRRGNILDGQLTNGPSKLAQAMDIGSQHNGQLVTQSGAVRLEPGIVPRKIIQTTRIGITKDIKKPWRFYIADNAYVSKK